VNHDRAALPNFIKSPQVRCLSHSFFYQKKSSSTPPTKPKIVLFDHHSKWPQIVCVCALHDQKRGHFVGFSTKSKRKNKYLLCFITRMTSWQRYGSFSSFLALHSPILTLIFIFKFLRIVYR